MEGKRMKEKEKREGKRKKEKEIEKKEERKEEKKKKEVREEEKKEEKVQTIKAETTEFKITETTADFSAKHFVPVLERTERESDLENIVVKEAETKKDESADASMYLPSQRMEENYIRVGEERAGGTETHYVRREVIDIKTESNERSNEVNFILTDKFLPRRRGTETKINETLNLETDVKKYEAPHIERHPNTKTQEGQERKYEKFVI